MEPTLASRAMLGVPCSVATADACSCATKARVYVRTPEARISHEQALPYIAHEDATARLLGCLGLVTW